tara:strand:+ start:15594 stop:15911 length:318 start_codon:yes stop_codon:yes gene_type:complete
MRIRAAKPPGFALMIQTYGRNLYQQRRASGGATFGAAGPTVPGSLPSLLLFFGIALHGTGTGLKAFDLVAPADSQTAVSQSLPGFGTNLAGGHVQTFAAFVSFVG